MTKELKARVRTLKSTHKITAAMKIVAATTFNRLKHQTIVKFDFLESLIALSIQARQPEKEKGQKHLLIIVGGDRGLCGGYNTTIRKNALQYLKEFPDIDVAYIGAKIILKEYKGVFSETIQHVQQWTSLFDKLSPVWDQYDHVGLIYTEFHNLYDQRVIRLSVYEPQPSSETVRPVVLDETTTDILPLTYTAIVMKAIIHAQLCEFSSRMLSMDNATQNAERMIEELHLTINKMRQARITKELSETVSGSIN